MKKLPLLWFLKGPIGDTLIALALAREVSELNEGVTSVMIVRHNAQLAADLATNIPGIKILTIQFTPSVLIELATALLKPWQIMSAWQNKKGLREALRDVFLLNPYTRVVRFDWHASATKRDMVALFDYNKLMIDNFRVLAQKVGLKTQVLGSPVSLPIAAVMPKDFQLAPKSYIVLHPLGSNEVKSLPQERAQSILLSLAKAYPQLSFVVTGGPQDQAVIESIAANTPRARTAAGLPMLEVAGLIQNAALYIGVDTGVTHLAAMMGKEMLALENADFPRWYPTYNPKTVMLSSDSSDTRILEEVHKVIHI